MALSFTPSIAGVWRYVDDANVTAGNAGALANSFYGVVHLGPDHLQGMVVTGWQYAAGATSVTPVNFGVLAQQADGTLRLVTQDYVGSARSMGGGSVTVADFNGDGRDDVFLAAHNETPFLLEPSVALMSNAQGTFTRIDLNDAVMAHDAELAVLGGRPTVVTASFREGNAGPQTSPSYTWNGTSFTISQSEQRNATGTIGMSVAVADFNGDGSPEIAIGDLVTAPGYPYSPSNKFRIGIFSYADNDIGTSLAAPLITPYLETSAQYSNVLSNWGAGSTHTYRLWVDDFNHDGRPDLLAGQSLWNPANDTWPSMLQMLQNGGNLRFTDVSDRLNAAFDKDSGEIDYEMQVADIDGSGIASYLSGDAGVFNFSGGQASANNGRHANFVMVNDGTGHLYTALHDEFIGIGSTALAYANQQYHDAAKLYVDPNQPTPAFHAYQTADGKLNFVAEVAGFRSVNGIGYGNEAVLVNVPLQYDVGTQFTQAITISDRNGSALMRTFAGNDRIGDANGAAHAHIDGGLGLDTAVYSQARGGYAVGAAGGAVHVSGGGLDDTLVHVERVQFADRALAFDLDANAGVVARVLGAVFGPSSVGNASFVAIGLGLVDGGVGERDLVQLALNFRLGAGASSQDVVRLLYSNLTGAPADDGAVALYKGMIDGGLGVAGLGVLAADHVLNAARIDLVGLAANGIAYA